MDSFLNLNMAFLLIFQVYSELKHLWVIYFDQIMGVESEWIKMFCIDLCRIRYCSLQYELEQSHDNMWLYNTWFLAHLQNDVDGFAHITQIKGYKMWGGNQNGRLRLLCKLSQVEYHLAYTACILCFPSKMLNFVLRISHNPVSSRCRAVRQGLFA